MPLLYHPCSDIQSKRILWIDSFGQAMDCVAIASLFGRKFAEEGKMLSLTSPLSVSVES